MYCWTAAGREQSGRQQPQYAVQERLSPPDVEVARFAVAAEHRLEAVGGLAELYGLHLLFQCVVKSDVGEVEVGIRFRSL